MADIFISYARADRNKVAALSAVLEQAGWSVWWDRHIDGGSAFAQTIETQLEASQVVIVAWSKAAQQSDWVKDEAATARDQGKLVPVSLDGTVAPLGFRQYHVIDLTGWNGEKSTTEFEDLVRSLQSRLGGTPPRQQARVPPATGSVPSARPVASRSRNLLLAGVALAGLLGIGAYLLRADHSAGETLPRTRATQTGDTNAGSAPQSQIDKAIAVLPFANRSARADDAYFAQGMHDDLLAQLARIGDLRVVSRTSVMRYADSEKPIPEIASELGVGVVLEGGVQRAGDRVRINVQLIDGRTDRHLWAETFDRELTVANLFDIQSEITRAIASELQSVLAVPAKLRPDELPTQSTEAFKAYLLGNTLYLYDEYDPAAIRRAAAAYGEAVTVDPGFATAHARKAEAHLTLAWWGVDVAENTRLAEQALERALTLAPQSNDTRVAEGYYRYWLKSDYAGADAAVRAALEQSPQDGRLWELRGSIARRMGDMTTSTSAFERAVAIDPEYESALVNVAVNHGYLGQLAEAWRWLSRAQALSPEATNARFESVLLRLSGDVDAAWRRYEDLRARGGSDPTAMFAWLPTMLRDPDRLEIFAARLAAEPSSGPYGGDLGFMRALALHRLGRTEEALALATDLKARLTSDASRAIDANGRDRLMAFALDALLGNASAARTGMAALRQDPPHDQLWLVEMPPVFLTTYVWLDEPDAAFDLVEQAMNRFSPIHFVNVKNNPEFDRYRDLPRYRKLDARYQVWKKTQPPAG